MTVENTEELEIVMRDFSGLTLSFMLIPRGTFTLSKNISFIEYPFIRGDVK